jgi:hypothetical protein
VIVDLKGFTITGSSIAISGGVSNAFPITVRNGTITHFGVGIDVENNNPAGLSSITISNLTITALTVPPSPSFCVLFNGYVKNSVVRDCTFNTADYGIRDILSPGGNRYSNITMNAVAEALDVVQAPGTHVLDQCEFAPAPAD